MSEMERTELIDEYPVLENIKMPNGDFVPLLDIPMMTDEKWKELAKRQREKHPDLYEKPEKTCNEKIYLVRFKTRDGKGISVQFEVEAPTPVKAILGAIGELIRREIIEDYPIIDSVNLK